MKGLAVSLLGIMAVAGILFLADNAQATANCALPVANRCHGESMVGTTVGGVASGRCFFWLTSNAATPTCSAAGVGTTSNQATWEANPGGCITLYWYDVPNGQVPPAVPNKVSLRVYFDVLAPVVKTIQLNAAEPANGASSSFCMTTDGVSGSAVRAGTYYIEIIATKDNGPAGVGNYAIGSAGTGTPQSFDAGGLRGDTLVSSISRNAYPAGSTFAYGPGADETMTVTSTFTQPGADNNVESSFDSILDSATLAVGQVGATVDVDATTTLAQNFIADSTFPFANSPYVPGWTIVGNSALLGERWTILATSGHGSGLTRVSDTFIYGASFNIDPRIILDSDGAGTFASADDMWLNKLTSSGGAVVTKYNRGETAYIEGYVFNARSEQLTRSMTFSLEDAGAITCNSGVSLTPTSGKYSTTYTVPTGGSCTVANTDPGSPRYIRVVNTDQNHLSVIDNYVSSLHYPDAHLQTSGTLNPDDYPTQDATETLAFFIRGDGSGGDASDSIRLFCKIENVRHEDVDTSGSTVAWNIKNPSGGTVLSGTTDTGSNGWTAVLTNLLATTPLSLSWTATCSDTFNGNSGTDTETFSIGVEGGGGGETVYTGADPLTLFGGNVNNGTVPITVHSRMLDGAARIGAASSIFVSVYRWPSMTPLVTGGSVVEVDSTFAPGSYVYSLAFPGPGPYLIAANTTDGATRIGAHNVIVLASTDMNLTFSGSITNPGLYWYLELFLWGVIFWYAFTRKSLFVLAFALGGVWHLVNPAWLFGLDKSLPWIFLGALLDGFIHFKSNKAKPTKTS